jgi:hypothetical protein
MKTYFKEASMPSGHASHKGTSDKPNTNAAGQVDSAADKSVAPQDVLSEAETTDAQRLEEAVVNPAATERPDQA